MKSSNRSLALLFLFFPAICNAGESSKGTVIMISSVSGWLVLSSGVLLWREIRRSRRDK